MPSCHLLMLSSWAAQDSTFLQELFVRLRASQPGQEEWADLVAFLQELCSLVKHLQASQRSQLLQKLTSFGLFQVAYVILSRSMWLGG